MRQFRLPLATDPQIQKPGLVYISKGKLRALIIQRNGSIQIVLTEH
jgi:hypothetical protein